jgi:hypothetical protein
MRAANAGVPGDGISGRTRTDAAGVGAAAVTRGGAGSACERRSGCSSAAMSARSADTFRRQSPVPIDVAGASRLRAIAVSASASRSAGGLS